MRSPEEFKIYVEELYEAILNNMLSHPKQTAEAEYRVSAFLYSEYLETPSQQYLDEAFRRLMFAAEQDHAEAQYALGNRLSEEASVKDEIAAMKWYARAARQGHEEARIVLKHGGDEGDKEAQYLFGKMYLEGKGVDRNLKRAEDYLGRAVKQGHKEAETCLNSVRETELKQKREAVYSGFREHTRELYKLFREHINPDGTEAEIQYSMGTTLCGNNPTSQDYEDAAELFKLSAAQGNKKAKDVLENLPVIRLNHELAMLQTTESKRAATPIDKRKTVPDSSNRLKRVPLSIAELKFTAKNKDVPPIVLAAKNAKKKIEKKNKQEKKPESRQEKSSAQDSFLTKTAPPSTLFSTELQTKTAELIKMLSKIDEMRELQKRSALDIKKSSDILAQSLKDSTKNKDRHLKLEANLADLVSLERYDVSIKAQETLVNSFLALLQGSQGTLTDEALQKNLTSADDKAKTKSMFTAEEFLALQQALTKNKSVNDDLFNCSFAVLEEKYPLVDEVFSHGLAVLEAKYTLFFAMISELNDNLIKLSGFWKARAAEHSTFEISAKKEDPQRVLPAAKMSRIENAVAQIKSILDKRIKTEEKTAQDHVLQNSQKTSASQDSGSQGSGHERGEPVRRFTRAAREQDQQPAGREHQEENALLAPKKKLSKAARKAAYEEQKAAKAVRTAERIETYRQKQAAKHAEALQKEQASARVRKLKAILSGTEMFPESETKTIQEETTTVERQHPLFKEKTIESYNELQKLKAIVKIITETRGWTPERRYAVLQSFAFVNEVVYIQHEHPATKEVARCLRNAIFKQYKEVMNIVQSDENLLGMANAWIKFLETPDEMWPFVNEETVLDKVSSELLSRVYRLGQTLIREIDVEKSCDAFEEMMNFGHSQCYETECGICLILGEIRAFQNSIEKGHKIIVTPDEETFIVYYKNKNNCEIVSFHCDEDQRALLSKLMFNGEALVRNSSPDAEAVYKQIYAAVAAKEGCTRFGDDIIGSEAARFYWAITGTERGPLEQAAKERNSRALALLKQFSPQLFRPEHLERGKQARHFKVLEEESKSINESANTDFGGLLFARNMQPLTSPSFLSDVGNGHAANLPNGQLHPSLSPVVPAVTFVFPNCIGDPKVNAQISSEIANAGHNSAQQVKSKSPKSTGD